MQEAFGAGNPAFLSWELPEDCPDSLRYRVHALQARTRVYEEEWDLALSPLQQALDLGGDEDEELLYLLWTAQGRLNRKPQAARTALRLADRFPGSPYLVDMTADGPDDAGREWSISASGAGQGSNRPYLPQRRMLHRARARLWALPGDGRRWQLAAYTALESTTQEGWNRSWNLGLSGEYAVGPWEVGANWGLTYRAPPVFDDSGNVDFLDTSYAWDTWNPGRAGLRVRRQFEGPGASSSSISAAIFRVRDDWWGTSLDFTSPIPIAKIPVLFLAGVGWHVMDVSAGPPYFADPELNTAGIQFEDSRLAGLVTASVEILLLFSRGRHGLEAGLNAAWERETNRDYTEGAVDGWLTDPTSSTVPALETMHTLDRTYLAEMGYTWRAARFLNLAVQGAAGWESRAGGDLESVFALTGRWTLYR